MNGDRPISLSREPQETMRSLLIRALQTWVLAQHLPQRVLAERLQIPRTAVSDLIRSKSKYAADKLLELWTAVGGQWEFRLTVGPARKTVATLSNTTAAGAPQEKR